MRNLVEAREGPAIIGGPELQKVREEDTSSPLCLEEQNGALRDLHLTLFPL